MIVAVVVLVAVIVESLAEATFGLKKRLDWVEREGRKKKEEIPFSFFFSAVYSRVVLVVFIFSFIVCLFCLRIHTLVEKVFFFIFGALFSNHQIKKKMKRKRKRKKRKRKVKKRARKHTLLLFSLSSRRRRCRCRCRCRRCRRCRCCLELLFFFFSITLDAVKSKKEAKKKRKKKNENSLIFLFPIFHEITLY